MRSFHFSSQMELKIIQFLLEIRKSLGVLDSRSCCASSALKMMSFSCSHESCAAHNESMRKSKRIQVDRPWLRSVYKSMLISFIVRLCCDSWTRLHVHMLLAFHTIWKWPIASSHRWKRKKCVTEGLLSCSSFGHRRYHCCRHRHHRRSRLVFVTTLHNDHLLFPDIKSWHRWIQLKWFPK